MNFKNIHSGIEHTIEEALESCLIGHGHGSIETLEDEVGNLKELLVLMIVNAEVIPEAVTDYIKPYGCELTK